MAAMLGKNEEEEEEIVSKVQDRRRRTLLQHAFVSDHLSLAQRRRRDIKCGKTESASLGLFF